MVGDIRTLSPLLLPPAPNDSFGTFIKSQVPNPVPLECWHFEDQEAMKKKIQEFVIVKVKHLVESSTPGQNPDYFRHVEEVVSCGQFGDPLGQFQAAGIFLKLCLGLYLA